MESIFDKYLGDLINLRPIKLVHKKNKKLFLQVFLYQEEPVVKDKTFSYYTGLIKSIESFSERMPRLDL